MGVSVNKDVAIADQDVIAEAFSSPFQRSVFSKARLRAVRSQTLKVYRWGTDNDAQLPNQLEQGLYDIL